MASNKEVVREGKLTKQGQGMRLIRIAICTQSSHADEQGPQGSKLDVLNHVR